MRLLLTRKLGLGRSPDLWGATESFDFLDDKHRAGCLADRVEDTSRPQQGSRVLLLLDEVAGSAVRPGTL